MTARLALAAFLSAAFCRAAAGGDTERPRPGPPRALYQLQTRGDRPSPAFSGTTLKVEAAAFVEGYVGGKMTALRRVRPTSKAALRAAVDAFNSIPGLRLKLVYAEAGDPETRNERGYEASAAGRFVAHWYEAGAIGCWPVYRQKGGQVFDTCHERPKPGDALYGASFHFVELDERTPPCGADSETTYALRFLAECLGLADTKDPDSIMGGACGRAYRRADREALGRLYGGEHAAAASKGP